MKLLNFDSENLALDWISFNLEGLINLRVIVDRFSKHFTPHVLIDDVPCIGYRGRNKNYKVSIVSIGIGDLKVNGLELRLFSLEKMRLIFMNLSKLKKLIGVF